MENVAAAVLANPDWSGVRPVLSISHDIELALNGLMALMFLGCVYYAVRMARKEGNLNAIYLLIGGTITVFFEPLGDLVAHVTFHEEQINAVSAYGFHVPTWMVPAYTVAVGLPVIWLVDLIRNGISAGKWWTLYALCIVGAILFELPLIYLGAIEYYKPQSFTVLGYPVWMAFMNCTGLFFVPATIVYLLTEHKIIHRGNAFLLVPLTPLLVAGAHSASGFTRGYVMNGGHSQMEIEAISLLSIAAALLLTWLCLKIVTR